MTRKKNTFKMKKEEGEETERHEQHEQPKEREETVKKCNYYQSGGRRKYSTAYTIPRFVNIRRCKGNKKIADVDVDYLLPCKHRLITALSPRVKLNLLSRLSLMTANGICDKYHVKMLDLQEWSKLLTECNNNTHDFGNYSKKYKIATVKKLLKKHSKKLLTRTTG